MEPEDKPSVQENKLSVQNLVQRLTKEANMLPAEIAEALENRVSGRTIYRWAKGESEPGNSSDYGALVDLVRARCT